MTGEIKLDIKLNDRVSGILKTIQANVDALDKKMTQMEKLSTTFDKASSSGEKFKRTLAGTASVSPFGTLRTQAQGMGTELGKMPGIMARITGGMSAMAAHPAFKTIAAGVMHIVRNTARWSDEAALLQSRLKLAMDQGTSVNAFKNQIMDAANHARVPFEDLATQVQKVGQVAGHAFTNDEMLEFTANFSKLGVVAGATSDEINRSMTQILQGMGKGKADMGDIRSVLSNMPMLTQELSKSLGKTPAQIMAMIPAGELTTKTLKKAFLGMSDSVEAKLAQMPMTFDAMGNIMRNTVSRVRNEWGLLISGMMNSKIAQDIFAGLVRILQRVANAFRALIHFLDGIVKAVDKAYTAFKAKFGGFIAVINQVKRFLKPLVDFLAGQLIGILVAVGIVLVWLGLQALWTGITMFWSFIMAFWPLFLIIAIIALIVGILYYFGGSWEQVFAWIGMVVGWAVALIWNLFAGLWDFILGIADYFVSMWNNIATFFSNVFKNPVAAVQQLFFNVLSSILNFAASVAAFIDKILGTNMAGAVQGVADKMSKKADEIADANGLDKAKKSNLREEYGLDRMSYEDAGKKGSEIGAAIGKGMDEFDIGDLTGNGMKDALEGFDKDKGSKSLNTSLDKDSIDELKAMAEIQYRMNYKHITPQVTIKFGDVRETADVGDISKHIKNIMEKDLEEMYITEGAWA